MSNAGIQNLVPSSGSVDYIIVAPPPPPPASIAVAVAVVVVVVVVVWPSSLPAEMQKSQSM